jgi:hypothetical protein
MRAPKMVQYNMNPSATKNAAARPKLVVKFFRQDASGSEPVRLWLKSLSEEERKAIGMARLKRLRGKQ